jgi:probable O-glycosylation ligase (exosortase A-associated)
VLRSLFVLVIYFAILGLGIGSSYLLTLGYLWTDMFRPNNVIYPGYRFVPVAFLMALAAVASYMIFDRRSPPRISAHLFLTIAFAGWITMTTLWAVSPDAAWEKWDWAFNTVAFSVFVPFVIRSKNQIEGFLQVMVFSIMADLIPFGVKTLVTGGGYGRIYGLINGQFFLGQGETLAAACFMILPIILFLMKHSIIIPRTTYTRLGYIGVIALAVITAIGTHERTALVAMVVFAAHTWWTSKRKLLWVSLIALAGVAIVITAPASWTERMSTVSVSAKPKDDSAQVRIRVWAWTLNFVGQNPQGGGFDAYRINAILIPEPQSGGGPKIQYGRAFHSSYFEVLGEHGWVGLSLFMALVTVSFRYLAQARRAARTNPNLQWVGDLSYALQSALLVMLACGLVIGIAFQPFFYYLFALSFCLREYMRRVENRAFDTGVAIPRPALGPVAAFPVTQRSAQP